MEYLATMRDQGLTQKMQQAMLGATAAAGGADKELSTSAISMYTQAFDAIKSSGKWEQYYVVAKRKSPLLSYRFFTQIQVKKLSIGARAALIQAVQHTMTPFMNAHLFE